MVLKEQQIVNQSGLLSSLLDSGYDQVTNRVIGAIVQNSTGGIVQQRLNELQQEAQRLEEAGEKLKADNPILRALLADFEEVQRQNSELIASAAPELEIQAADVAAKITREMALPGLNDRALASINMRWNTPNPDAVISLINYTDGDAFKKMLSIYSEDALGIVANQAIRGMVEGWGPLRSAREIRRTATDIPAYMANNYMRTLQLESYRSATTIHQTANADIIEEIVRIGVLDTRICLCCVALNGTRLRVGEKVQDHHQGRCTSIAIVRGRSRSIVTGQQWFDALPDGEKLELMGPGNFDAFKAGKVQLRDFVQTYNDPVFGDMVREASLRGILGDAAQQYYH